MGSAVSSQAGLSFWGLSLRHVLALFAILAAAKVLILLSVYLVPYYEVTGLKFPPVYPSSDGLSSLIAAFTNRWDGANYIEIASSGYPPYVPALKSSTLYAFSPVYPAIILLGSYLAGSIFISSFLVTNLLSFAFPLIVFKLFDFKTALIAELFPTYLVYTTVGYSDALALVLLGLTFVFLLRGRYLYAGLSLGAASLVFYDLFLAVVPILGYLLFLQKDRKMNDYVGLLIPVAVAATSLLLGYLVETGSALTFFSLERSFWGVKLGNPVAQVQWVLSRKESGSSLADFFDYIILGVRLTEWYWILRNVLFEAFLIGGIALLARTKDPRKWLFVIYSVVLSVPLFFVLGTPVLSIPRLMLAAFPMFAGYATVIRTKWQMGAYVLVSLLASLWVVFCFVYAFFA